MAKEMPPLWGTHQWLPQMLCPPKSRRTSTVCLFSVTSRWAPPSASPDPSVRLSPVSPLPSLPAFFTSMHILLYLLTMGHFPLPCHACPLIRSSRCCIIFRSPPLSYHRSFKLTPIRLSYSQPFQAEAWHRWILYCKVHVLVINKRPKLSAFVISGRKINNNTIFYLMVRLKIT